MKKILIVTGGAGFIGFNYLSYIISNNFFIHYDEVHLIDKLGYATKYNKNWYMELIGSITKPKIFNVINDINNLSEYPINKTDINLAYIIDIVNFASQSHVDNSIKTPNIIYEENTTIPSRLISYAGGVEHVRKFVQISTDEVYGDLPYDIKDNYNSWFSTTSPLLPNNPYAASKAAQDCFLRSMAHTFGLNLVTVRMANQFGPYQHVEKMLPASILRAVRGETIKIYGEGKNIRQWTPVTQTVQHIKNILKSENNTTIHLGAKQTLLSNNEIVEMWRKILFDKYKLKTTVEYIEDRKGHDKMYAIQSSENYTYDNIQKEFEKSIKHYVKNAKHYAT